VPNVKLNNNKTTQDTDRHYDSM